MAKDTEKTTQPESDGGASKETPAGQTQPAVRQPNVDASHMTKSYANFCQVHPGPEELAIDFGFSPSNIMSPQPQQSDVLIDHRIIVNYYMAKRLLGLLQASVQRYESLFGVLETNIQKRVQPRGQ